jgi:lipoprotein-anchoring transpeptidase ErfK/SrfK
MNRKIRRSKGERKRFPSDLLIFLFLLFSLPVRADGLLPPWTSVDDVPLPYWARSVAPAKGETVVVAAPGKLDARRATTLAGTRLPLYGAVRARGCSGRWLHVGLESWLCSDLATLSPDPPSDPPGLPPDGLPYRYFFVGKNGASGYGDLAHAGEDAPDEELDPGFAVATVDERTKAGSHWVLTRHGTWIDTSELGEARASTFAGEPVASAGLDFAWVLPARLNVYSTPNRTGRPEATLVRREVVRVREEKAGPAGPSVRISDDGVRPGRWVSSRALARPTLAPPPREVTGRAERWIDVELATQTLVAYEGPRPVFATLVSTGAGPPGSDTATRKGTFRIWVKLLSSTMDNLESPENQDARPATEGTRYSMEDVPYVQFFDKSIALHGVFWHDDFGRVHSHGCVNLAPRDAARLFAFTSPRLTGGLSAILPSRLERGTVVRVR